MTEEYWDNSPEEEYLEDQDFVDEDSPFVFVNGSHVSVTPGSDFTGTVKDVAKNAGLGKFRLFVNGYEKFPSDAPETIGESDRIELRKYDVAG